MKERQPLGHCWWEYKSVLSFTMKNSMQITQKIKNRLPYDPAILLLGIYPKKIKTLTQKDTCIPMFTAALFTVVKIWKQPRVH